MPGRFKGFHYYNAGALFDALMAMIKPMLSKKLQERVRQTIEAVCHYFPLTYISRLVHSCTHYFFSSCSHY